MQLGFVVSGRVEEMHGDVVRHVIRSDVDTCAAFLTVMTNRVGKQIAHEKCVLPHPAVLSSEKSFDFILHYVLLI